MSIEPLNRSFAEFTAEDLARIKTETPIQHLEYIPKTSSTNDLALEYAKQEGLQFPLLVLAAEQTAGRGRHTNRWWSDGGALTFSLLLEAESSALPPRHWPQASLTTGLAVSEALEQFLPEVDFRLKWPNDVYASNRKICGILVEASHVQQGKLVLGIGINVNNRLATAPADIAAMATSMYDLADQQFPLADVLVGVLNSLFQMFRWIGSHDQHLRERWRRRCLLTGRQVRIETVTDDFAGLCRGIDDEGALLVQTENDLQRCFAGTVTLLEE